MVLKQGPATRRRDAGRGCSCVGAEALHPWCNWHAWALYWAGLGERASRREADLGARVPELQRDRARAAALLHRVVGPRARGARPACNTRQRRVKTWPQLRPPPSKRGASCWAGPSHMRRVAASAWRTLARWSRRRPGARRRVARRCPAPARPPRHVARAAPPACAPAWRAARARRAARSRTAPAPGALRARAPAR